MITFDDVTVRFDSFTALPGFSLQVEEGEFFTLLGPSGCGKSTALRALAGFVDLSAGDIHVAGRKITHLPSGKREVGMVFQNYALFPGMNVRENIAFGLRVQKLSRAETDRRVNEIAERVDLSQQQLGKQVSELSGGQQQRVAIARALVLHPKVLLLDEPLSNLDAKLRRQLRGQLKQLQGQFGITTVYVTHDQDEALSMSDRIAVLDQGRIEQVGTPQEVYDRSATEFVCTFVGEVNRLSPALVGTFATAGASGLDSGATTYVRIEKVKVIRPGAAHSGIAVPATVDSHTYHGMHNVYHLRTEHDRLRAVATVHGGWQPRDGERVDLVFDPDSLLQYSGGPAVPAVQDVASAAGATR
ncbi:ABC transporter ATP-binding protein [Streptomyces sp. MI02-2A]|uniref:ABC transporter ATP-binding protein n=1 Tax=Streptomyces sp. MI02-2A TaxID=3028688 RepID=UPI0029A200A5|nr:ABC transporter ATP-binding protein [Streptomyces sp. MI02-2A]MDX3264967.1 ABC transporter ATP-binding protein [Streptomyces sp. MI02-2A]